MSAAADTKPRPKKRSVAVQGDFYAMLEPATVAQLREAAERIRVRLRRSAEDIVEIGRELLGVKDLLGHGEFLDWLRTEFDLSERTARNFMRVATVFGGKSATVADLAPKVLYELAAPSTPDEVVEEITARAAQGEKPTVAEVREAKQQAAQTQNGNAGRPARARKKKAPKQEPAGEKVKTEAPAPVEQAKSYPPQAPPEPDSYKSEDRSVPDGLALLADGDPIVACYFDLQERISRVLAEVGDARRDELLTMLESMLKALREESE